MQTTYAKRYDYPNLLNCRDLGGYPLPQGHTRWGKFLRCAFPGQLPPESVQALADLDVGLSVDLRGGLQGEDDASDLAGHPEIEILKMPFIQRIGEEKMSVEDSTDMGSFYVTLLRYGQECFYELFLKMAKCEKTVLFHCTAGKDRTGVVAALLLSLAGASRQDIIADYEISHTMIRPLLDRIAQEYGYDPEMHALRSVPSFMARFLDELAAFGGAEAYLKEACGLPDWVPRSLKDRLIEPLPKGIHPGMRRIALESWENFRDLGGVPTNGGLTAWGRVYRSAFPEKGVSEESRRVLLDAGITTVIDLRSQSEDQLYPHPLTGDDRFHLIRTSVDDIASVSAELSFPEIYRQYLRQGADHYARVLRHILYAPGAVLLHCFSGKDRTGMIAALLLRLAGAALPDIAADYQVSITYLTQSVHHRIPSDPHNILAFLDEAEKEGGVQDYLTHTCRLTAQEVHDLRQKMLG